MPNKNFTLILNCFKQACGVKVSVNDQGKVFDNFYSWDKEQQDTLLAGYLTAKSASTHCLAAQKHRDLQWKYSVKCNGTPTSICHKFVLDLYEKSLRVTQVKEDPIQIIQTELKKCGIYQESTLPYSPVVILTNLEKKHSKLYFENPNFNLALPQRWK